MTIEDKFRERRRTIECALESTRKNDYEVLEHLLKRLKDLSSQIAMPDISSHIRKKFYQKLVKLLEKKASVYNASVYYSKIQTSHLRQDLETIDKFFLDNGYYRWDDVESAIEYLQKGFELLEQRPLRRDPTLLYDCVLAYGKEPEMGHGEKRFFIDAELWNPRSPNYTGFSYQLKVEPFQKIPEQILAVNVSQYFELPPIGLLPGEYRQPLQKKLNEIKKLL